MFSYPSNRQVTARYSEDRFGRVLDAGGAAVLPGFVDGHTHPVWAGDRWAWLLVSSPLASAGCRVHEFALKLGGASYMEVHAAGGGIHFTVDRTRCGSGGTLV